VTSLGSTVFINCTKLKSVLFKGNAPSSVGSGIYSGDTLTNYVYQSATGWGEYFGNMPVVVLGPLSSAPNITNQPADLILNGNAPANFSVTANGSLPLSYQWRLAGTNIPNANQNTYSISNVRQS
jgi:hypothetical protein